MHHFEFKKCSTAWRAFIIAAATCFGAAHAAPRALLTAHVPIQVATHRVASEAVPNPHTTLHLAIALPMRDQAGLDTLLHQIYDPASPRFRQYLSAAAFTARFGPTSDDYAAAVAFFTRAGLRVTGISANRYIIDIAASAADIERVFHVVLRLYPHPTEHRDFIAPDREPTLDLAVPVLHVSGLDDFVLPTPRLRQAAAQSQQAGTGSGPHGYFIGSDIRAAYYGPSPYTNGPVLDGAGQSVGLMELGPYNPIDVTNYFAKFHQNPAVKIEPISTDGGEPTCDDICRDGEQALDIEYAISMAPGMDKVQVYVGRNPESVLNRMASDNSSKQLSTSWGWNKNRATDEPIFKEMAVQGQTNLTASGDDSSLKASGPWPEEDAYITSVGGTDLTTTGPGGAWLGETGWKYSAGGPSVDRNIKIPDYQIPFINERNAGSTVLRNVPDIAGDGGFSNYICYNLKCNGGWGGTSFAAPIWAGFIALANQQAAAHGEPPVGFLNPALYALAGTTSYPAILHDQKRGTSGLYKAVSGFDLVTGLGSPAGQGLIDALAHSSHPR